MRRKAGLSDSKLALFEQKEISKSPLHHVHEIALLPQVQFIAALNNINQVWSLLWITAWPLEQRANN